MVEPFDVAALVYLNGGQLIGKTRLQKSAYFLEMKGVGFGIDFSYYRFGPYSDELSASADDAEALKLVEVHWKESQAGIRYAIFSSTLHELDEDESNRRRQDILGILKGYSATEVELAATCDFLKRNGYGNSAWKETQRRKANKINDNRLENAQRLLRELDAI